MTRAAVLGKPIAHSLSPVIHNAGYAALGLTDWSYTAIECDEAGLPGFVAGLGPEWAGLSLTMPLKEVALKVATEVAPLAATVGAANTLVRRDAGWYATNTDVEGMVTLLTEAGVTGGARFTVLGAGGTARAAVAAAAHLAAESVTVVARRQLAIEELAAAAADLNVPLRPALWPEAQPALAADVVISTVPKGVADPIAINATWHPSTIVFDAIYDPWPTPLADSAASAGCHILSGLDLLLAQALGQFRLFTGAEPPTAAMREALFRARS
ncbi:shikimate dehydrogenase [Asanoa sp. WMMD1127]|uniref:shikimate dehydrogenase n=1 Tax=Asanoa sp. WMMD1127 TaxID=3016107 RepID=UPI002415FD3C|nr:shikimate dehydrogenase [Asanoa sp. WMMD1127]MDG4824445.1 shikimate dehydrogenase [Asanoa sp. WMMD1127]